MDNSASDMKIFARIVACGSLSAAGRDLGLSVAVISKRLMALEQRLGVSLLNRTTRRLSPTAEGTQYYERATKILADIDATESAVSAGGVVPRGTLKISASPSFGRQHIAPYIEEFQALYPQVEVSLDLNPSVINLVEENIDVAIRIADLRDSDTNLIARRLAVNRRVVCGAPKYFERRGIPMVPADLLRHNCLVLSPAGVRQDLWRFETPDGPISIRVSGNLVCNTGDVLRDWALAGLGLALKSTWDVGPDLRSGRLRAVLTDQLRAGFAISAIYAGNRHMSPKVKAFVDFLAQRYGTGPAWDEGLDLPNVGA
jgi:DNA-binding transcriptional LysR family regulator